MSSSDLTRRRTRVVASSLGLGLAVAALSAVSAPAAHAAPVELQLLNINDFHGRIDADTTKFATTIEQLRAAQPHTLFLSAGDNIGASVFASSVAQDNPTIDVLNALELDSSAVGNHEFDKGSADLLGRVTERANWRHLGANVYEKGTTTPVLPEYDTFEVGGLTVGVIGVVTEETGSLVTPGGIADIEFGDPVEAVNRVAAEIDDETDVIVAEYHEGAGDGEPDSSLDAEVEKGGAFAAIVEDTDAAVDVIFTGHSHATYAWEGAVEGGTRPVVQTGSYGANIGQVTLSYDAETDSVTSFEATNVARAEAEDVTLPRVAAVKTIVDQALAEAAEIGNRPIGRQTADITTAYTGGSFDGGTYSGGARDDRASESTLGNLVAQTLLEGPTFGEPDFGVTNSGGLRAELLAAGDTALNPANTDGVITYAEAAEVLPFGNTVALVELTGAQVKAVFEQQWREDAEAPYLQLGVSDNLRVTVDPARPAGDRVTSIRLDGAPLDPEASYTVSTLNFLASGGDAFTAFAEGTVVDTGILDVEMFADQIRATSPVSPDFARQQVEVTGNLPETITGGDELDLGLAKLDLTSQGSPVNTRVSVFAVNETQYRRIGTVPVTEGKAEVKLTVPAAIARVQQLALVAEPSRTVIGAPIPRISTTTTARMPTQLTYADASRIRVDIQSPLAAAGEVRLMEGTKVVARTTAAKGVANFALTGRELNPGWHRLHVEYGGDADLEPSATAVTRVAVAKALPRSMSVSVKPRPMYVRRSAPVVQIRVQPVPGFSSISGQVRVRSAGRTYTANLRNGRVNVRMRAYPTVGRKRVVVAFLGGPKVRRIAETVALRVVRP